MALQQGPLVSVVTPVHNGERFLRGCIESVLAQTFTNWDYTIVDNCSTDKTPDIAREYAARDPRIRVHCNESFVPVIANYNNALRRASPAGKYCKVVAADDRLLEECLERMVRLAEEHPSVAIVGAYGLQGARVSWYGLPYPGAVVSGREVCRMRLMGGKYVFGTPTSLLYRADIVRSRHAFFNESNLHSDSEACMEFLEHHDFGFVHQILTIQGVRPDSLTSFSRSFETYLPGLLHELETYGPKYLGTGELESRISEHLREYYRYLGSQVFRRRGREFWEYHRAKLAGAGHPLGATRLVWVAISHVLDLALNPKRSFEGLVRRMRRRPDEAEAPARSPERSLRTT
jgi:glycosyltransferase involved in cell wall biosynthesis